MTAAGTLPALPDRVPNALPMASAAAAAAATTITPDGFAKDAIIAWFRGEFAAANAIIDTLCNHLTQLDGAGVGDGSAYEAVFAAIHRRRLNWIPVLHMQKHVSIAEVAVELRRVAEEKERKRGRKVEKEGEVEVTSEEEVTKEVVEEGLVRKAEEPVQVVEKVEESVEAVEMKESAEEEEEFKTKSIEKQEQEGELKEGQLCSENNGICLKHEDYETRRAHIKITKGFVAKEMVKGHMVNVVKGLKLYEDIFTDLELSGLTDYINELRKAGKNGELTGETYSLFNQMLKDNKRELIQLGVPIFGKIHEQHKSNIEPIPAVLQTVIDHLVHWHILSENKRPNSCLINFFDEGEYSQPYVKPPHLDQPITTLVLSESTLGFGRILSNDQNGNFKGPLMLTVKPGSLIILRGNSADMAKHAICSSATKRVCITFCKVRQPDHAQQPIVLPHTNAMTIWEPRFPQPQQMPNGTIPGYNPMEMVPDWRLFNSIMLAPMPAPLPPMARNPWAVSRDGTGVFLPWNAKPRKHVRHLPPRAQRNRVLSLPPPILPEKIGSGPAISV